jgi:hypothetical protein
MPSTSWYLLTISAGNITALRIGAYLAAVEIDRAGSVVLATERDLIELALRERRTLTIRKSLSAAERARYFRVASPAAPVYALAS